MQQDMPTSKCCPTAILILCSLGTLGLIATTAGLLFFADVKSYSSSEIAGAWLTVAVTSVAITGLWRMKKWGVILYSAKVGIALIVAVVSSTFELSSFVGPALVVWLCWHYYPKMS